MIRAVLFDFDGVLTESIEQHIIAWRTVLAACPVEPDPLVVRMNEGLPARLMAQALFQTAGLGLSDADALILAERKNEAFRRQVKPSVFQQIPPLLRRLRREKIKTAVVTGTKRANMVHVLGEKLLAAFDVVVQDGDYARPKPDPEPFLLAAAQLAVPPQQCLVIENAPHGIRAAKRAEMFCIALLTTLPKEPLAEADVIVKDHDALLPELFRFLSIAR